MAPNVYDDERAVPDDLKARRTALETAFAALAGAAPSEELRAESEAVRKALEECQPDGSVFARNARRWRRRGWLEEAYPGVGLGAVVPSAWSGFGCNLMTRAAADLCDWTGYDGQGTEDVFINRFRWAPAGVRIACITHAPCSHVLRSTKRDAGAPETFTCRHAYHESGGEFAGHLRVRDVPFQPEFSTA